MVQNWHFQANATKIHLRFPFWLLEALPNIYTTGVKLGDHNDGNLWCLTTIKPCWWYWTNCNKMIKEIKVTSQRSPISDILHVFLENIFPRKHHLGIERPWAEWKKSLWKAISISPTSLHRILTSCQNWKQSFILHQGRKHMMKTSNLCIFYLYLKLRVFLSET